MAPDPPRCLRLRRSQGALRLQDKFHVRCLHTHVRYFTKLVKTLANEHTKDHILELRRNI